MFRIDFSKISEKLLSYSQIGDFQLLQKDTTKYIHSNLGGTRPNKNLRSARKTSASSRATVSNNKQMTQEDIDEML